MSDADRMFSDELKFRGKKQLPLFPDKGRSLLCRNSIDTRSVAYNNSTRCCSMDYEAAIVYRAPAMSKVARRRHRRCNRV